MRNHYVGDLLHTMAISELSSTRTEVFQLLVIPSSAPRPIQTNCQSSRHGNFCDLAASSRPIHVELYKARFPAGSALRAINITQLPTDSETLGSLNLVDVSRMQLLSLTVSSRGYAS
jgi:hypothetical protein